MGLPHLEPLRPTALPALLMLWLWPVFMLLPARYTRAFFILSGIALVTYVDGALVLGVIAVATFFLKLSAACGRVAGPRFWRAWRRFTRCTGRAFWCRGQSGRSCRLCETLIG